MNRTCMTDMWASWSFALGQRESPQWEARVSHLITKQPNMCPTPPLTEGMEGSTGGSQQLLLAGNVFSRLPAWGRLHGKGHPPQALVLWAQSGGVYTWTWSLSQAHILKYDGDFHFLVVWQFASSPRPVTRWEWSIEANNNMNVGQGQSHLSKNLAL